jgi:hypothetical protein
MFPLRKLRAQGSEVMVRKGNELGAIAFWWGCVALPCALFLVWSIFLR